MGAGRFPAMQSHNKFYEFNFSSHKNTSRARECRTCGGPYRLALDDRLKDSQERCVYGNSSSIKSKVLSNNNYFILRKNVVPFSENVTH